MVTILENKKIIFTIACTIALLYLFAGFNYELNIYDEAVGIYGAQRILNGDIPYLDFWTIYSPGYFYILSSVLYVLGNSILVERIFSILVMFINLILIYSLSEKLTNKKIALIPLILSLVWFGYSPYYGKAVPLALLFGLLSLLLIINLNKDNFLKKLISVGILTAITFMIRHDFGFYFFISILIFLLIRIITFTESDRIKIKLKIIFKYYTIYLIGVLILILPVGYYFIKNVGFDRLYNLLIYVPSEIFPKYRSLPFPLPLTIPSYYGDVSFLRGIQIRIETMIFYFPFLMYLFSLTQIFFQNKRNNFNFSNFHNFVTIFLIIIGILLLNQFSVRSDKEHLIPSLLISFILFGLYFYEFRTNRKMKFLFIIISLILMIVPVTDKINMTKKAMLSVNTHFFNIPKVKGICDEKSWAVGFEQTVHYVNRNVPEYDKILVSNYFHDKVLMNDFMIYYLSERNAGTRYHEFHPGITTRADVQKEIIYELKKNDVQYIIQCPNIEFTEPNMSSISSKVFILDNYINSNYIQVKQFGGYRILYRKSNLHNAE